MEKITGSDEQDDEENENSVGRLEYGIGGGGAHSSPPYVLLKLRHLLLRHPLRHRLQIFPTNPTFHK